MQPHPPPRRHHVYGDILPETAFFGPGLVFSLLELGTEGVLESSIGVRLAVADQAHVDVIGIAEIDVRQQTVVTVAGLDWLETKGNRFATDPRAKVIRSALGEMSGAVGCRVVHLGGVDAEQADDCIVRIIRVNVDRVAVDHLADGKRAMIEAGPVILRSARSTEMIPTGEGCKCEDQEIAADAEKFPLPQGTGEMDPLAGYFTFSSSNASCTI